MGDVYAQISNFAFYSGPCKAQALKHMAFHHQHQQQQRSWPWKGMLDGPCCTHHFVPRNVCTLCQSVGLGSQFVLFKSQQT
eukprot:1158054-Pelagomonas_calceolata.AAC.2